MLAVNDAGPSIMDILAEERAFTKSSAERKRPPLTMLDKEDWIIKRSTRQFCIMVGAHVDATNHIFWTGVCLADLPDDLFGVEDYERIRIATGIDVTAIQEAVRAGSAHSC
jgi:hypothetical protein